MRTYLITGIGVNNDVTAAPYKESDSAMTMMMSRKALEEYGLANLGNIYWNLSPAVLVEHALARKEGMLAANGAFAATTGSAYRAFSKG